MGLVPVTADLQVNGVSLPWYDISIDMNVYAISTAITATSPISVGDDSVGSPFVDYSNATDWTAIAQRSAKANTEIAMAVELAYGDAPLAAFEQGVLDIPRAHYKANQWEFQGRSTAAVFQDNPTQDNLPRNVSGVALVQYFFKKRGIPLTVYPGFTSKMVQGKAYQDSNYQKSLRNASEWDYMQDAASADGCVLTLHNGQGYYGPAAGISPPTITVRWPDDIDLDDEESDITPESASRRTHFITVTVDSWNPKTGEPVSAKYSSGSSGGDGTNFRFFIAGLDLHKARGMAYAIWQDLVTKEVIVRIATKPKDSKIISAMAKYGPNFLVQLEGGLPSHNLLYHVKQASTKITASDEKIELGIDLLLENHVPVAGGGAYV